MVIAVVSVLAMVGLWLFGGVDRAAAPTTLQDPAVVAAALPTTVPAGWVAYTDVSAGFFARFPAAPTSRDEALADGSVRHVVEATRDGSTYTLGSARPGRRARRG